MAGKAEHLPGPVIRLFVGQSGKKCMGSFPGCTSYLRRHVDNNLRPGHSFIYMTTSDEELKEKRRRQLRESQQRRREKLAAGDRHQVNIYLSQPTIKRLDGECARLDVDRHEFLESLLKKYFET